MGGGGEGISLEKGAADGRGMIKAKTMVYREIKKITCEFGTLFLFQCAREFIGVKSLFICFIEVNQQIKVNHKFGGKSASISELQYNQHHDHKYDNSLFLFEKSE